MVRLYTRHVVLSEVVSKDHICDYDSYLIRIHTWYIVLPCTKKDPAIGVSEPTDPEFTKITPVPTRVRAHLAGGHIPPRDDLHNLQLAILCTFVSSILVLRTEHLPLGILWMFCFVFFFFFEYAGFQRSLGFNLGKHLLYLIIATPGHPR